MRVFASALATAAAWGCSSEIPSGRFACELDVDCPPRMWCEPTPRGKRCVRDRGARDADSGREAGSEAGTDAGAGDAAAFDARSESPNDAAQDGAAWSEAARPEMEAGSEAGMIKDASPDAELRDAASLDGSEASVDAAMEASTPPMEAGPVDAAKPYETPCIRWIPWRASVDDDALFAGLGSGPQAGIDVVWQYLCRLNVGGRRQALPGKAIANQGCFTIAFENGGIVGVMEREYELGVPAAGCAITWRECDGILPEGASVMGIDAQRKPFYACNIQVDHPVREYAGSHIGVVGDTLTSSVCYVQHPESPMFKSDIRYAVLAAVPLADQGDTSYCEGQGN